MPRLAGPLVSLFSLVAAAATAVAAPVTVPCSNNTCVATITNPSNSASYTLTTTDDGTNFITTYQTANDMGLNFANIYLDTTTSTNPASGSNLGFEITNDRAFIPGAPGYYSLNGTGITFTDTIDPTGAGSISLIIPNSFLESATTGIPFVPALPGGEVTVHYSQAFGYDMIGGSNNYTLPNELGGAFLPAATTAATPEPGSFSLLLLGGLGGLPALRTRLRRRRA